MQKNRFFILLFICGFLCSCSKKFPEYLPNYENLHNSPYGAYMELRLNENTVLKGELIAVTKSEIFIKTEGAKNVISVSNDAVNDYNLKIAKSEKKYKNWSFLPLSTLFHGWWGIITIPANIITVTSIQNKHNKLFLYYSQEIPLRILHKFSRYPQGLPDGVSPNEIK